jgi:hypothetical protein
MTTPDNPGQPTLLKDRPDLLHKYDWFKAHFQTIDFKVVAHSVIVQTGLINKFPASKEGGMVIQVIGDPNTLILIIVHPIMQGALGLYVIENQGQGKLKFLTVKDEFVKQVIEEEVLHGPSLSPMRIVTMTPLS